MKRVITLQNQHSLKKNYTYNFFRSSSRFNSFFLKNNFFLFKFYRILNFFFFINFLLKKKIIFNRFNISPIKQNKSLFLNRKNNNILDNLYGNNYIIPKNDIIIVSKFHLEKTTNTYPTIISYNYNNILSYHQLLNTLIYINIKQYFFKKIQTNNINIKI